VIALLLLAKWALAPGLGTRTPILTFHDVIQQRDSASLWFDCSEDELDRQLSWLTAHGAHFVSIQQVYRHLAGGEALPKKAIAITFADGYEGFYLRGLPILRKHHVPVSMFVHTDYVGDQHNRPKMTWAQLKELDREGLVTICSQTRTHPADLRTLSDAALSEEMSGSKRALERQLGHPVPFLAYPNGKFDLRVARAAQKAGYAMAFTEQLMPSESSPNLFMVARYVHTKYRQAWHDAYRH
jgi:peptidoglycan/xylan/chitin deacetylase (PgdA/CDA1 family)